jgi:hypothetical protein
MKQYYQPQKAKGNKTFGNWFAMGGEVFCAVVLWMVSFAFCGFVFLQVKSDGVVMLIAGFDGAWCCMVSFLISGLCDLFFIMVWRM